MKVQLFTAQEAQKRFNGRGEIELGFKDLDMQKRGEELQKEEAKSRVR